MAQISPKIFHVCPTWVEDIPNNEYNDIQRAIDNIPDYSRYTIKLYDNFMNVPELILTNLRVQVKIDGQGDFGIYFVYGSTICTLADRKTLKFVNMTYIRGGSIVFNGDGYLTFDKCQSVMANIDMSVGNYMSTYIYDTKFYGASGGPAITLANTNARLIIYESYIRGGYLYPAIYFGADSDGKVKLRNSVLLRYYGTTEYPIQKLSTVFVGLYAYNCVGDEMLCSNEIANYTATNNDNKADPNINF